MRGNHAGPAAETPAGKTPKISPSGRNITEITLSAEAGQSETPAELVRSQLERMKSMSPDEFAIQMADSWLAYGNVDEHLRRALYLSACNGERAVSFYREYIRRKGGPTHNDQQLREFFTIAAKQDGKRFVTRLLEANPEGVGELDSLVHGWAAKNPSEAVAWINSLPEGTPYYARALKGAVWGLAESSPSQALKVYEQLDANDRNEDTLWGLTNSTVMNHGLKGLTELISGVSGAEEKGGFVMASMEYSMKEPPADFVKWMAEPLEATPALRHNYEQMAARWAVAAPEEALRWLGENALKSSSTALSVMSAQLIHAGRAKELDAWLTANPSAPGRAAIEAGRNPTE